MIGAAALVVAAGSGFAVFNFTDLFKSKTPTGPSFVEVSKPTFPELDEGVKSLKVGETLQLDDVRLTINELRADKITKYDEELKTEIPQSGDFLILEYTLENESEDRNYFLSSLWNNAHLLVPGGEPEGLEKNDVDTKEVGVDTVRPVVVVPGGKRTGQIVFSLPKKGDEQFRFFVEPSIKKGAARSAGLEVDEDSRITLKEGEWSEMLIGSTSTGFDSSAFALEFERGEIKGIEGASGSERASLQPE